MPAWAVRRFGLALVLATLSAGVTVAAGGQRSDDGDVGRLQVADGGVTATGFTMVR